MNRMKKYTAAAMALLLTYSALPLNVSAQDTDSQKEEVIYVMADAAGTVKNVYAVNIFGSGSHVDFGSYTDLKVLNTMDTLKETADGYSFTTDEDKVYVQGTLPDAEIPWDISITYYLDEKEMSAEEIAGKNGKLKIMFDVAKNRNCTSDFYEGCALQADFTLDTKKCKNITSPDATIANVGSKKQLTYTILPNKGIHTTICADVTDFEMTGVAVNGVKLNLNMNVDTSSFSDRIQKLTDGIGTLDDGAKSLSDGTDTLKNGTKDLKDGSQKLASGANSLNSGVAELENGVKKVQDGLNALYEKNEMLNGGSAKVRDALNTIQEALNSVSTDTEKLRTLMDASGQIKSGISSLKNGAESLRQGTAYSAYQDTMSQNGIDIPAMQNGNSAAIQAFRQQITALTAAAQALPDGSAEKAQLQSQIELSQTAIQLLTGSSGLIKGTQAYFGQLNSGAEQLYGGIAQLDSSYDEFHAGMQTLVDTISGMLVKLSSLSDGINELAGQYSGLDNGIHQYTDGVAQIVSGYQSLTSGASALTSGSKELKSGADELKKGASALYDGTAELSDGSKELADGTGKLRDETNGIDEKINTEIESMLDELMGRDVADVSFVSDKNTKVSSVQFVIKTDSVVKPIVEAEKPAEKEKLSFWQKLKNLFK